MKRARLDLVAALAITLLACAGEPPQQTPVPDSEQPLTTEDTPPVPPPSRVVDENKIGRIPLLNPIPGEGACINQSTEAESKWTFEGEEFPRRSIRVGAGSAARAFPPTFLEIRASQPGAVGVSETETVFVLFSAEGLIESGNRQFFTTGSSSLRQSGRLLAGDTAALKEMALGIVQRCQPPKP